MLSEENSWQPSTVHRQHLILQAKNSSSRIRPKRAWAITCWEYCVYSELWGTMYGPETETMKQFQGIRNPALKIVSSLVLKLLLNCSMQFYKIDRASTLRQKINLEHSRLNTNEQPEAHFIEGMALCECERPTSMNLISLKPNAKPELISLEFQVTIWSQKLKNLNRHSNSRPCPVLQRDCYKCMQNKGIWFWISFGQRLGCTFIAGGIYMNVVLCWYELCALHHQLILQGQVLHTSWLFKALWLMRFCSHDELQVCMIRLCE